MALRVTCAGCKESWEGLADTRKTGVHVWVRIRFLVFVAFGRMGWSLALYISISLSVYSLSRTRSREHEH